MFQKPNDELKKKIEALKGNEKKVFESLVNARQKMSSQMEFHSSEALNPDSGEEGKGVSTHMADYGSDKSLHDMQLGMITDEGHNIEYIDDAIRRLLDGTYGICMDCSAKIGKERLIAKPSARFCVKCKTIREKNGGLRPDYN
jgi:DnaK suppressor protein